MFYWILRHLIAGPLLKSTFRPWVRGVENVPAKGAVILASNHLSVIDSVFLPLVIDRPVSFLAKKEYFTGKGVKGALTREFFKGTGMLPIDRSGGAASDASLKTGLRVLNAGRVLGIYPEGTRSPDARMYRGRTGIARMIMEADENVTVVPVAMVGTEKILPIGSKVPRLIRPGIIFGEPLEFSRFRGLKEDRFLLRSITDEIMSELSALSDQEFRDVYASSVRQQLDRQALESAKR
ncbi:1-acyl-sn-glycerol-3-phosphate acyltransferase [Pseudoclavibacter chungangensis]|uniref:1-acyl-sn-glycerol-3-phosphate acyltransferase n=1 Tax=Pseudoclavibacter chungangensis TaxID=587635 RepID=A0A7J5C051_9MICO|nr:lysophospholipid acyltransferase family protein [Pseudoclavibacter chungangensis]KAB1660094.1 1-acyl-sn-glycerol-3-phosphate acyltransferase [Pseudoclavibacter chungangensis]NYJ66803.1 1-acyl-sn-glycerol-3-phosphate acyltransferase [Pseudoclavibacter chungangensis]